MFFLLIPTLGLICDDALIDHLRSVFLTGRTMDKDPCEGETEDSVRMCVKLGQICAMTYLSEMEE